MPRAVADGGGALRRGESAPRHARVGRRRAGLGWPRRHARPAAAGALRQQWVLQRGCAGGGQYHRVGRARRPPRHAASTPAHHAPDQPGLTVLRPLRAHRKPPCVSIMCTPPAEWRRSGWVSAPVAPPLHRPTGARSPVAAAAHSVAPASASLRVARCQPARRGRPWRGRGRGRGQGWRAMEALGARQLEKGRCSPPDGRRAARRVRRERPAPKTSEWASTLPVSRVPDVCRGGERGASNARARVARHRAHPPRSDLLPCAHAQPAQHTSAL
jgi:hypothetical protein